MASFKSLVSEYSALRAKIERANEKCKDLQQQIITAMDKKSIKEVSVNIPSESSDELSAPIKIKLVETTKVDYDLEKAMEKCPEIVKKEYTLNDENKTHFIVCLKKLGIDKKQCQEILKTMNVEYSVSSEKLSRLIDKGEIDPKILKEIAFVKQKSRYIRLY